MKFIKNEEEAVSPVIGVILMVAIVVILAAVIAAFVFGMAGSSGTSKNVGMTITKNSTAGFDILWQGGTDINSLQSINWTVNGAASGTQPLLPAGGSGTSFKVGEVSFANAGDVTSKRVIVIGSFSDGSNQVLFDRKF